MSPGWGRAPGFRRLYIYHYIEIQAADFGSFAQRKRWYAVAIYVGKGKFMHVLQQRLASLIGKLLPRFQIATIPAEDFVAETDGIRKRVQDLLGFPVEEDKSGKVVKESKSEDEHFELYRAHGYTWPPEIGTSSQGYTTSFLGLSRNQIERVLFCHQHWPRQGDSKFEFIDVNCSLGALVGFRGASADPSTIRNPWKDRGAWLLEKGQKFVSARLLGSSSRVG